VRVLPLAGQQALRVVRRQRLVCHRGAAGAPRLRLGCTPFAHVDASIEERAVDEADARRKDLADDAPGLVFPDPP
jgi:hypothetical protein